LDIKNNNVIIQEELLSTSENINALKKSINISKEIIEEIEKLLK
jgi:hypothetical protein